MSRSAHAHAGAIRIPPIAIASINRGRSSLRRTRGDLELEAGEDADHRSIEEAVDAYVSQIAERREKTMIS
jgi:hypothetical protein